MSGQIWRKNAKIKESLAFVKKIQILVIDTEGIKFKERENFTETCRNNSRTFDLNRH